MDYLLDTNALLWLQSNPKMLSRKALKLLEDPYSELFYSPISIWEIVMKFSSGGAQLLEGVTPDDFLDAIDADGYQCLDLLSGSVATSYKLPFYKEHRDPFDRMLVWEALQHDLVLVSADQQFKLYEKEGLRLVS